MNKRNAKLKKCYRFPQTNGGYFVFEAAF